jgi:hypothetical protein
VDTPEDTTTTTEPSAGATAAAEPWMQLPLRAFLTGDPGLPIAVTLVTSGADAILLGRADASTVELLRDGRIVREPDSVLGVPVTDPGRQVELLRAALVADVATRKSLAETVQQRGTELNQLRVTQGRLLDAVRDYAIEQYRSGGDFDRDVLDGLLERLGVDPYWPRVKVTYTITGSFEVDSDNGYDVENDVENNLRPYLDDIDDVDEDSGEFRVSVRSVEPVDD